jgi:putative NADH-flavin reductase
MPVIVVGADTNVGRAVIETLLLGNGEIRAFVTDPAGGEALKAAHAKVAIGDVSDASHIGGAALGAHSAVLVADAASDDRERAFAPGPEEVFAAWAEGLQDAGVARAIWVGDEGPSPPVLSAVSETMTVPTRGRSLQEVAAGVADLDDRPSWA